MVVSLFIDFSTVLCLVGQRGWECLYIKLKVSELWLWLGSLMCCLREKEREVWRARRGWREEEKVRELVVCTLSLWFPIEPVPSKNLSYRTCPFGSKQASKQYDVSYPNYIPWQTSMFVWTDLILCWQPNVTSVLRSCDEFILICESCFLILVIQPRLPMSKPGWYPQANSHLIHIFPCLRPTQMYDTVHCQGVDLKRGDFWLVFFVVF